MAPRAVLFRKRVKRRDRQTLQAFAESLILSSRSVVVSDCHKGYANLSQVVRHFTVNHIIGLKNLETGKHTNNAEGCHSVIKRWISVQCWWVWPGLCHVAVQCSNPVCRHGDCNTDDNAWGVRLGNLLVCFKSIMRRTTSQS